MQHGLTFAIVSKKIHSLHNMRAYTRITTQMNDFIHGMTDESRDKNNDDEMICSTEPGS